MPTLLVRPVTPGDVDAVLALWRAVFPEYRDPAHPQRDPAASIARKLAVRDGLFWLAEELEEAGSTRRLGNGEARAIRTRIVGTAMAGWDGHRGWLYSVGVHPEARRAGVGARLVAEAERALRALGAPKINLQILAGNDEGKAFWRRMGYAEDAVVCFGKRI